MCLVFRQIRRFKKDALHSPNYLNNVYSKEIKKRIITVCTLLVVLGLSIAGYLIYKSRNTDGGSSKNTQTEATKEAKNYSLKLQDNPSYEPGVPTQLEFNISDQSGNTEKEFDSTQESELHLIVIRKDRTNFQHLHPSFDQSTGTFKVSSKPFQLMESIEYLQTLLHQVRAKISWD